MQLSKPVGAAVMLGTAILGAAIAKVTQQRGGKLLVLAEAFASGCLLCAALVHLLSDASKDLDAAGQAGIDGESEEEQYPYAALLCGLGALGAHFINGVTQPLWTKLHARKPEYCEEASGKKEPQGLPSDCIAEEDGSESTGASQAPQAKEEEETLASGPVLLAALSVHSVLEGLCLGAAEGEDSWELFLAILLHKGIAAFMLGVTWLRSLHGWRSFTLATLVFSSGTPIGILIGQSVEGSIAGSVLKAIAAGTFLYIGLTETAPGVRTPWLPGAWRVWQMFFCLCGFSALAALGLYV